MNTPFTLTVKPKQQGLPLYTILREFLPFFQTHSWQASLQDAAVYRIKKAATQQITKQATTQTKEQNKEQNKEQTKEQTKEQAPVKLHRSQAQCITGNPKMDAGDTLVFTLKNYTEPAVNTHWHCYWQNQELLVAYKPANLPVQRTTRNIYNTLTALIQREANLPQAQPLHRLDQETAGLIVFAKDAASAKKWQPQLKTLLHKKTYHALVQGKPAWQTLGFNNRLGTQPNSAIRCKMHCTPVFYPAKKAQHLACLHMSPMPKMPAHRFLALLTTGIATHKTAIKNKLSCTHFKVCKSWEANSTAVTTNTKNKNTDFANNTTYSLKSYNQKAYNLKTYSLIHCALITGRKHQLRAQLAHLGHPIVGDKIYANNGRYYLNRLNDVLTPSDKQQLQVPHHLLVACALTLHLPTPVTITLEPRHYPKAWQMLYPTP